MTTPKFPAMIPLVIIAIMIGVAVALLSGCAATVDRAVDAVQDIHRHPGGCITIYEGGRKHVRCDR